MASPRPVRHTPHTFRAPPGAPPMAPAGASTASPRPLRHTSHTFRAPQGAPPVAPSSASTLRLFANFGTPLTRVVPHPRELYPWPPRVRPHGVPAPMSAHPSHVSCPSGSSTHGPNGCAHMASPRPSRHTLTSLVPLQGAPGNRTEKDTQRAEEVRTRSPEPSRAHPSRISHPTGSPSFGHSAGKPPGPPSMKPEHEPPQRRYS